MASSNNAELPSELTHKPAGAQFICASKGGCDITYLYGQRDPRDLAGRLLEELTELSRDIRALPDDYPIPAGVRAGLDGAYEGALAWVEWLDAGERKGRQ